MLSARWGEQVANKWDKPVGSLSSLSWVSTVQWGGGQAVLTTEVQQPRPSLTAITSLQAKHQAAWAAFSPSFAAGEPSGCRNKIKYFCYKRSVNACTRLLIYCFCFLFVDFSPLQGRISYFTTKKPEPSQAVQLGEYCGCLWCSRYIVKQGNHYSDWRFPSATTTFSEIVPPRIFIFHCFQIRRARWKRERKHWLKRKGKK